MYQRTQTNENLTQKDIVLVQNSHRSILGLVLKKWKVFAVWKIAQIAKRGRALADLMAVSDRVIKRTKMDFLVRLSEQ